MALKTGLALFHTPQMKHGVLVSFCLWREGRELAVPIRELLCRGEGNHDREVLLGAGRCPTVQTASSVLGAAAKRGWECWLPVPPSLAALYEVIWFGLRFQHLLSTAGCA